MGDEGFLFGGELGEVEAQLRARSSNRTKTQLLREVPTSLPAATIAEEAALFGASEDDLQTNSGSQLFVGALGSLEQELRAKYAHSSVLSSRETLLKLKSEAKRRSDHNDRLWTPIHQAALVGDLEELRKLLGSGNSASKTLVNAQNSSGQTPLHVAVLLEHTAVAQLLLDAGASEEIRDIADRKPLDEASAEFRAELGRGGEKGAEIQLFECLGKGTHGAVFRGQFGMDEVAIKTIDWTEASKTDYIKQRFEREAEIAKLVSGHRNVLRFIAAINTSRPYRLVTDFASGGTLYDLLHRCGNIAIREEQKKSIIQQTAAALAHIHSFNVMHLDLKSLNLVLNDEFGSDSTHLGIKLIDYGSARRVGQKSLSYPDAADGTYFWSAPEVLSRDEQQVGLKSDVYSWAMVAYEVLTRTLPFENLRQQMLPPFAIAIRVSDGERPDLTNVPIAYAKVLEKAWTAEPSHRPTADELVNILNNL